MQTALQITLNLSSVSLLNYHVSSYNSYWVQQFDDTIFSLLLKHIHKVVRKNVTIEVTYSE